MKITTSILSCVLAAASVTAHATFQQLWVNGVDQGGTCVRRPASNSPVTSVGSADLACNVGGTGRATSTCTVNAGGTVTVEMHQQPGDRGCGNEAIGGNHDGPVIVYMAKVPDAASAVGSQVGWFKIGAVGLIRNDYWGTDQMNANCGRVDFKIPSDIASGDYLLRAEVIALHSAGSSGGAQFYMSCFQLSVTGGGTATPSTVRLPGAYKANDPGILYNLYPPGGPTQYTIPGPPVYGGGGPSNPLPPTSARPSSTAGATPSQPVGTVPQWGQCGGIGWTGGTVCISPYRCVQINDYYSQCQ